jgi:hypothetical protein
MQHVEYGAAVRVNDWWVTMATTLVVALILVGGIGLGYWSQEAAGATMQPLPAVQGVTLNSAPDQHAAHTPAPAVVQGPADTAAPAGPPQQGPALAPVQFLAQLPKSYTLPIHYGTLGPQLVAAGAIDLDAFTAIYAGGPTPLSAEQNAVLARGSEELVTIDRANAHFLLNFFWAVGLANRNPILLEGAMQEDGPEHVANFSSTAGWTLAARPVMDLYASLPLIKLSEEQQRRVQSVAENVYRPCCGNNTAFPDCNHGMAMLAVLELMAAEGAGEDAMYDAAKHLNAFWFPDEMRQVAAYFKLTENISFGEIDGRLAVSHDIFSSTGSAAVRQWLTAAGHLR